jgi:hypothetical protein
VLIHSGNHYPLGNCDSPGPETSPDYLTRFEAVSNRSWPPSSLFAFTDSARTLPEELVKAILLLLARSGITRLRSSTFPLLLLRLAWWPCVSAFDHFGWLPGLAFPLARFA